MSDIQKILVPDVGGEEVEIIEICFAVGDTLEANDGIITVETDKASMDIPAPMAGELLSLAVKVGDKIKEGDVIGEIKAAGAAKAEEAPKAKAEPEAVAPAKEEKAPEPQAAKAEEPAQATEAEIIEVTVPDIGGDTDVEVIEILVAVGDKIEAEVGLVTLETDKATMDVPAPKGGIVKEVKLKVGDKVSQGSLVILLEVQGATAPAAKPAPVADKPVAAPAPQAAPVASSAPAPAAPAASVTSGLVHSSPSVRRTAREFGVDLSLVKGTGRKNRILREDVQNYVKAELAKPKSAGGSAGSVGDNVLQIATVKPIDFSKFGEIEVLPLTRIQKISGPFLHRNWVTIPHVTQFDEADITDVEEFRKEQNAYHAKTKSGLKITPLVFVMKAVAKALEKFPTFNSSLSDDGESLILKKFINIGIAVETPGGLVVPVIRDVNKKGIEQLSQELIEISGKARDGKLKAADMQGGTFTISSLGGIGGTAFTPIVNAPEVAILGVSKSDFKPKWNGKEFVPRLMVPLSLSYDHRVIDGAVGARFSTEVAANLTDLRRLVL
ncbi:dihydrolipoyllysine-residue acetyltransferase [Paraglaciecola hydrolytica]|uniref:Acetyltransferase component of pyruvate dehydrogenase complex n=1 Tax=Paraglaciecola hydrolytica TaxID=1799789 RepID=A0A136A6M7_9ALTE|nr:dihydrolipoyllysine-residue acetyltransferase [Paraglaciecola hydrolytica]KXI30895.1 dihydrolipoamide acetyltransferase [Paraglaciecola hydrolytica]